MIEKDDWRLIGQEGYLQGVTLFLKKYKRLKDEWDHEHCEFCWQKITEQEWPGTVTEAYTTEDSRKWICPTCYHDFKARFEWILAEG